MAIERYPYNFPLPQRDPLSYTADMGVRRTDMVTAGPRQKRKYKSMPHYFSLEFVVPVALLYSWQSWIAMKGYRYFEMPLVNAATTGEPMCENYCIIRLTSDLSFAILTKDNLRVTVSAELAPGQMEL